MRSFTPVLLSAALALAACQRPPGAVARVDPELSMLVPVDTAILVDAKLDQLRETRVYREHFSQMALPRLDEFTKDTGLDPRKDISEVLFASDGKQSGVLMARGKFAVAQLEPKLERQGAARTHYKNHDLFGDERNATFFMNSSTALAGSTPALKTIIDKSAGAGIPASLQTLVKAVPTNAQFWAVFNGSVIHLPFAADSNLGNLNQIVNSIQNGRFSADLGQGFAFQADGLCTTDADAKKIHDFLKGIIGFGRLSTPENQPEMLKIYDSIEVKQEGRDVNVAANLPQAEVDKFLSTFLKR